MLETFEENDVQTIYSGVSQSSFFMKQNTIAEKLQMLLSRL